MKAFMQTGAQNARLVKARHLLSNEEVEWEHTLENDEEVQASWPQENGRRERDDEEERSTPEGVGEELPYTEGNARFEEESVLSSDCCDYHEGDESSPGDENKNEDDELASSETLAVLGADEDNPTEEPSEATTAATTESATAGEGETTTSSPINVCNGESCHSLENLLTKIEHENCGVTIEPGPLLENEEGVPPPYEEPAKKPLTTPQNSDEPRGGKYTDPEEASSVTRDSVPPEHSRLFSADKLDVLEANAPQLTKPVLEESGKEIEERLFPLDELELKKTAHGEGSRTYAGGIE
ncbi:hypothetical protein PF004_g16933 [Phytophthora fragariae]|uniref:Uncharacterized protein n=1 Tax=Phytophthora fragariae TaxID=53985 RepID=A0A6G0NGV3_9STRA|nr:hypothetical protein PF004_g16933 [Phytophthora fragariae]